MSNIISLSKDEFNNILETINKPSFYDSDYLYEIYNISLSAIEVLKENKMVNNTNAINHAELIFYCLGEFVYSLANRNNDEIEAFKQNEKIKYNMGSVSADKYLSLSIFNHYETKLTNKYLPPISSLNIYINFMLNILSKYEKNDPKSTLITDLLTKSLSISRSILNLLMDGYETEAFATWRTLHECESTLVILEKYGDNIIDVYLKHMNFGIAFKNGLSDKEEQDKVFYSMKDEMRLLELKSKDIKKYIEYGWLYSVPGVKEDETFKLNFRDGLEKIAGLSHYSKIYEISSEIIHSTPILIYANKEYYYYITILNLYESFFRLEHVFTSLFSKRVSATQLAQYQALRNVYYTQLVNIHAREVEDFHKIKK